ncbi:hypothetical protein KPC83_06400 [Collinsella sp. zg1085]|uniref:hypothetical protein n=1 Tax=Collinsella sp. zg1085 TaxID=2844380 RepID=UPI001C0C95A7|nr:hypothetical protein [Collinsella sp. zg1085]QWT17462.1 hypothetical protein KPC83_06400 [Collinsella sp. zg1085]
MIRGYRYGTSCLHPSPRRWWGIELFVEEAAYTTVTAAVALLVVLALVFSISLASWSLSRAGDVQAHADATALAGANVISSYHSAATVVDACVLSLGLTGFCVIAAGMVGLLIPGVNTAAGKAIELGIKTLKMRNKFTQSASKGLQTIERVLPYLVVMNGMRVAAAENSSAVRHVGVAIPVPLISASKFLGLGDNQVPTNELEATTQKLDDAADELREAQEKSEDAKRVAWLADCGQDGMNLQERAGKLSGLSDADNPDYASSITWPPVVALTRARAYYAWRKLNDTAGQGGLEAQVDAVARHAFYEFALSELEQARFEETDEGVICELPNLPKNTSDVRATRLYTDAVWPTTQEPAGLTLHFSARCPGAKGSAGPLASLAMLESGSVCECPYCHFGVGDLGKTPLASSHISNGFEYHLHKCFEALRIYAAARNTELELERSTKEQAKSSSNVFEEALAALVSKRPKIAPPGRFGCIAGVLQQSVTSPAALEQSFNHAVAPEPRLALAAAVLAKDPASSSHNALASFVSRIKEKTGSSVLTLVGDVMGLWGRLLMGYGDMHAELNSAVEKLLSGFDALGVGSIARWLGDRARAIFDSFGLEPVDLSYRKPVLTDSKHVIDKSDIPALSNVQSFIRSLPLSSNNPHAMLQAVGISAVDVLASTEFTVAEIPVPGGKSIPLTIRLKDLVGAGS